MLYSPIEPRPCWARAAEISISVYIIHYNHSIARNYISYQLAHLKSPKKETSLCWNVREVREFINQLPLHCLSLLERKKSQYRANGEFEPSIPVCIGVVRRKYVFPIGLRGFVFSVAQLQWFTIFFVRRLKRQPLIRPTLRRAISINPC